MIKNKLKNQIINYLYNIGILKYASILDGMYLMKYIRCNCKFFIWEKIISKSKL